MQEYKSIKIVTQYSPQTFFSIMKSFFTLICLFYTVCSFGQSWFDSHKASEGERVPGWVVTIAGDTLHGNIKYNNPGLMSYKVIFWDDKNPSDRQKFKGKDLQGYWFADAYWEAIKFNDGSIKLSKDQSERLFVRPIIKGRLSMYELYTLENDKLLEQEGNNITILPTELVTTSYLKKEGGEMESLSHVKFLNFKKAMGKVVEDCEIVAQKVAAKEYGRGKLYEIIKEYNQICSK